MHRLNGLNGGLAATDWTGILQAGASIFNSISDSKTSQLNNESAERQLQLQIQAQQEQADREVEQFQRYMKLGLVGGGIILGAIIVAKLI